MSGSDDKKGNIFAAVVESSPSAIIAADLNGTIIAWNPAAEQMTGFSAGEVLGTDILSIVPGEERADAARLLTAARGGEVVSNRQVTRLRRDGSLVIGSLTVAPIRGTNGEVDGTVGIMHDVTERIAMEELLRRNQRLASIGTLAAGIAHEINNPVGGILMAAQYAGASLDRDDARTVIEKALADIETDARRCGEIVSRLLRLVWAPPTRTECDLGEVIEAAIDVAERVQPNSPARVQFERPDGLPRMDVNGVEIEQALVNVICNAVQANSSRVDIDALVDEGARIVRIIVTDDGAGIDEELIDHLFDPFFTTSRRQGNIGLGLSVAHSIVAHHGGSLNVASSSPNGTTVTLDLPLRAHDDTSWPAREAE